MCFGERMNVAVPSASENSVSLRLCSALVSTYRPQGEKQACASPAMPASNFMLQPALTLRVEEEEEEEEGGEQERANTCTILLLYIAASMSVLSALHSISDRASRQVNVSITLRVSTSRMMMRLDSVWRITNRESNDSDSDQSSATATAAIVTVRTLLIRTLTVAIIRPHFEKLARPEYLQGSEKSILVRLW